MTFNPEPQEPPRLEFAFAIRVEFMNRTVFVGDANRKADHSVFRFCQVA